MIMANRDSMETGCESQRIEFFSKSQFLRHSDLRKILHPPNFSLLTASRLCRLKIDVSFGVFNVPASPGFSVRVTNAYLDS